MTYETIGDEVTMPGGAEGALLAGRYRVVRQLGQGGMGSVWLAEDTQLDGKQFAIKMLPSVLVSNKRAYRQLKDEALVAMKLVHPNIVQLRAFEENNGNPFLVMDYIDGETLDDYLADYDSRVEHVERVDGHTPPPLRGTSPVSGEESGGSNSPSKIEGEAAERRGSMTLGGIPESDVIRLLKPIAAALDYAHSKGVVHRDVKPGNVMIAKDGTPYILDFGIAREIQETLTRVTGKLSSGTLLYMSPEQLHGDSPKPAQDIYSFAAMTYECLKGEPPFSRGQIEYQIDNDMPEPLPALSVMAGLAKKPEDRPPTCAAVLERIEDVHSHKEESDKQAEADISSTNKQCSEHSNDGLETGATRILELPGGADMEMIYCAPGEYREGAETEVGHEASEGQSIRHFSNGFWLGKYPVTQRQWMSVMGTNPSYFKGDNLPVDSVSYSDCMKFIAEVNVAMNCHAFLPYEHQWEYACRAGTTTAYSWGNSLNGDRANCVGWLPYGTTSEGPCLDKTTDVGRYGANPWGFCDMHGNVKEWCMCEDLKLDKLGIVLLLIVSILPCILLWGVKLCSCSLWLHICLLAIAFVFVLILWLGLVYEYLIDPIIPRVLRGGAWNCSARECCSASRSKDWGCRRKNSYGFRLCIPAE